MGVEDLCHHAAYPALPTEHPATQVASKDKKSILPRSERLTGLLPGQRRVIPWPRTSAWRVWSLIYEPLSTDSDVLLAGSLALSDNPER